MHCMTRAADLSRDMPCARHAAASARPECSTLKPTGLPLRFGPRHPVHYADARRELGASPRRCRAVQSPPSSAVLARPLCGAGRPDGTAKGGHVRSRQTLEPRRQDEQPEQLPASGILDAVVAARACVLPRRVRGPCTSRRASRNQRKDAKIRRPVVPNDYDFWGFSRTGVQESGQAVPVKSRSRAVRGSVRSEKSKEGRRRCGAPSKRVFSKIRVERW